MIQICNHYLKLKDNTKILKKQYIKNSLNVFKKLNH